MRPNKLTSTILATVLCLCGMSRQAQAQQSASSSGIAGRPADAASHGDVSTLFVRALKPRRAGFSLMPSSRSGRMTAAAVTSSDSAVHGSGTVGTIPLWTDIRPNGDATLGDSIVTQLNGNIGIGIATPTSKLTVQGMIETTLGGFKFPDGTVQTTAAVSGLQSVTHDSTLMGAGTAGSPLGLAVPLNLIGATAASTSLVTIRNTGEGGHAVEAKGARSLTTTGGKGIVAFGGDGIVGGDGIGGFGSAGVIGAGRGVVGVGGQGFGDSSAADGVDGRGGFSEHSKGGSGVRAEGGFGEVAGGIGVKALGGQTTGQFGGDGIVANGANPNGRGVIAIGGTGPTGYGVEATGGASTGAGGTAGAGLFAKGGPSSGSNSQSGFGLFAIAGDATNGATRGRAGAFEGDVTISDNLTVSGNLDVSGSKHFKIDHPLDPEKKYLIHASIESSEVLDLYSGNVVTDAKGNAIVTLPDWFEALNSDLRYQLTVVGTFAQAIVAEKVKQNRFTIKTSAPNTEVSWQVTGVRSDRMMQQRPFRAVEDKPERERGTYINPELYNQPKERGVEWARNPEMVRQLQQRRIELEQTAKPRKPAGR